MQALSCSTSGHQRPSRLVMPVSNTMLWLSKHFLTQVASHIYIVHSSSWRVQHQICCCGCCHVVDASLHKTEQRALLPRSRELLCCVCCIQSLPLLQSGHVFSQQGYSIDSCLLVPCYHLLSSACSRNQVSANLTELCFMCVLASFLTQTTAPLACTAT